MDMNLAIGRRPLADVENCFVIITEYNGTAQGFLVRGVERIVNMNWSDIHPPPKGAGKEHYLTAVTEVDGNLVEIVDVEKILAEAAPVNEDVSAEVATAASTQHPAAQRVLVLDDSRIARNEVRGVIEPVGVRTTLKRDGREGLDHWLAMLEQGKDPCQDLVMVISDIEMPEMA